jgi:cytochrome c oxidase cbb3-type subunit 4
MDLNTLRSVTTVVMFAIFVGIVVWAYSRRHVATFEDAARLPLIDDAPIPAEEDKHE